MRKLLYKIKPESGVSHIFHIILNAALPFLILIPINLGLVPLAAALILLSKWRMFAVKPRYWLANIRANSVDIFVGLSVVAFIAGTNLIYTQIFWTIFYVVWMVWLKQQSKPVFVMVQALVAQAISLVAFYGAFPNSSILVGIIAVWLICYSSARHFLSAFDEPLIKAITNIWAWFGAVMAWILGHWAIDYLFLPQIALVLSILGYGLATIYYLSKKQFKDASLRQSMYVMLMTTMGVLLLIIIVFSDWQDKTV